MPAFQINVSRNFNGGESFMNIEAQNKKELMTALKSAWKKTAMTHETGECFLYAKVNYEGDSMELLIGDFVFYSDGEFNGKSYSGFNELDDDKWEQIGYEDKSNYMDDDVRFEDKIKHIFKISKTK